MHGGGRDLISLAGVGGPEDLVAREHEVEARLERVEIELALDRQEPPHAEVRRVVAPHHLLLEGDRGGERILTASDPGNESRPLLFPEVAELAGDLPGELAQKLVGDLLLPTLGARG